MGEWMVGTAQGGRPWLAGEDRERGELVEGAGRRVARTPNPLCGPCGSQPALVPRNLLAASALPAAPRASVSRKSRGRRERRWGLQLPGGVAEEWRLIKDQ